MIGRERRLDQFKGPGVNDGPTQTGSAATIAVVIAVAALRQAAAQRQVAQGEMTRAGYVKEPHPVGPPMGHARPDVLGDRHRAGLTIDHHIFAHHQGRGAKGSIADRAEPDRVNAGRGVIAGIGRRDVKGNRSRGRSVHDGLA